MPIPEVMAGEDVSVQCPALWPLSCTKSLHKDFEASLGSPQGWRLAYLDDFLIIESTKEEAEEGFQHIMSLLEGPGFTVNLEKSQPMAATCASCHTDTASFVCISS